MLTNKISSAFQQSSEQFAVCQEGIVQNLFGLQPWYACLPEAEDGSPHITKLTDVFLIIFPLVDSLLKIAVYVAIGMIFFMLFKFILARGDSGKITQATHGIRDAVIGLTIALIAVIIVNFISYAVTGGL